MPQLHELRDGHAFAELAGVPCMPGRSYGGLLPNYSAPQGEVGMPTLGPSDVLVLTTRPPLSDNDEMDSRPIKRSGTRLETAVLNRVGQIFRVCNRANVRLSESVAAQLPPAYRNRAEMVVNVNGPVRYTRYRMPHTKSRAEGRWHVEPENSLRTPAFLLFTRIPDGPMLLNAFAMDGPRTLIWCYLVRTRFPQFLDSARFVMAEMRPESPVPDTPLSLSFADRWPVDILLNHPLP